jgi:adenylate cyclase
MERRLAAILCADVHGYSRLMGENEEATVRNLSAHRSIIDRLIEQHHGRFVNSAGDSVLAEFASAVHAVECAVEIQTVLKTENAEVPPGRRMEFRIGVNLGDVVVQGEEIYGDGVNVAARLESLAEPGSIYISASIHEQISNKLALCYEELGERHVKNIAKPVRVFRVLPNGNRSNHTREVAHASQLLARRHVVISGTCNRADDVRAGTARVVQAAPHSCLDSATRKAILAGPKHAVYCGSPLYEPERQP